MVDKYMGIAVMCDIQIWTGGEESEVEMKALRKEEWAGRRSPANYRFLERTWWRERAHALPAQAQHTVLRLHSGLGHVPQRLACVSEP